MNKRPPAPPHPSPRGTGTPVRGRESHASATGRGAACSGRSRCQTAKSLRAASGSCRSRRQFGSVSKLVGHLAPPAFPAEGLALRRSYCRLVLGPIGPGFVVWTGEPWLTMHAHDQSLGRLKGRAAVAMTLYERKRHMAGLIHELAVKRKSLASA